ncbi:hypothetical protein MICAB_6620001 [Microcystis aeruginosa PCC 9717]|uniref:Uncharacterized protein n=1 Tax=Microcystis aeruginosa PCC 9717 TaxID=1160286 RepID=I4FVM2_MICAE|nr:hypothetical protein MICAB_6620001 [Microcystis aeruginosa PCC 9717]
MLLELGASRRCISHLQEYRQSAIISNSYSGSHTCVTQLNLC